MGNLALKIILFCVALLGPGLAVLLFYKNKISKKWALIMAFSTCTVAIAATVLVGLTVKPQIELKGSH